jgi:glycosyltransferase involved in cell wall biosynthesis
VITPNLLSIQERFRQHKVCVLIPTYNNERTLKQVLEDVLKYSNNVIVVNDGATDGTPQILQSFPHVDVVTYEKNVGKGWALRQGFKHALAKGFDYAVTIDSDGQHFAEDLPKFIDKLEEEPGSLSIGARNMEQSSVPGKSSFGNKFSNFWYWVETGLRMPDTQSGYRLYPIRRMEKMNFFTRKFEFEIEVIVRASWRGIPVNAVPVKVFYAERESRVSHFRPFKDFSRISVLNTVLVTIALLYIKPRDLFLGAKKKTSAKSSAISFSIPTNLML